MDYKKLIPKIFQKIKKNPRSFEAYNDLFTICRSMESENHKTAHNTNAELRRYIVKGLKKCCNEDVENFYALYKKSLLFDAPHNFDSYLLYLEINRKPEERFYQPRRKVLKDVADALQALTDGIFYRRQFSEKISNYQSCSSRPYDAVCKNFGARKTGVSDNRGNSA